LALLAATLASACGASSAHAPTRAEFAAAAEAICGHEQVKLVQIARRAPELARAPTAAKLIRQQVAQSQLATTRLEDLRPPAGDGSAIKRWLTARTVAATVALDLAEAPLKGATRARVAVAGELARRRAQARSLAQIYGLRRCGELD
jgi:hypothetical protein